MILCVIAAGKYIFKIKNKSIIIDTLNVFRVNPFQVNPFVSNTPFLYSMKTSVFGCFQGVEKGCIGKEQVNAPSLYPMKTSEIHLTDVFMRYRNGTFT